jgi:hypothetical protein
MRLKPNGVGKLAEREVRTKSLEEGKQRKCCLEDDDYKDLYKYLFVESDFLRYTLTALIVIYFKKENLFNNQIKKYKIYLEVYY